MNVFLRMLSEKYPNDSMLLVCDGAAWHKSNDLVIPNNIELLFIPPYTPEMNPIEEIWTQIRKMGFRNEVFETLSDVVDRLSATICSLEHSVIQSITGRDWILGCF